MAGPTPTQRTRIVSRKTAPPSAGFAATAGTLSKFFGKVSDIQAKKEDDQRKLENTKANTDLTRLISSNPDAALRLKESGDFQGFFDAVGHKIDPSILTRQPVFDDMRKTLGTSFAIQGRAELRKRLREMPPGSTTSQVIADYITENTGLLQSEGAKNAFAGATMKFAETDSLSVSEERRRVANKTHRAMVVKNSRAALAQNTEWNSDVIAAHIEKASEGYTQTGMDAVTAKVRATDDYEKSVIEGLAANQPWATAASNVEYGGRPAMASKDAPPEIRNAIEDAKHQALGESLRVSTGRERKDLQTVQRLHAVVVASGSAADLQNYSVALSDGSQKWKRGDLFGTEWAAHFLKLARLTKAVASKHVDMTDFVNGKTVTDSKVVDYLLTPQGEAAYGAARGITDPAQIKNEIISGLASQSTVGFGKDGRARNTFDLTHQTDENIAVAALNRVMIFENSGLRQNGLGRAYDKEAEPMVLFMKGKIAGKDNITGTADDTDAVEAFRAFRAQLDINNGVLPRKAFLTADAKYLKTQIFSATNEVLSLYSDSIGSDVSNTLAMRLVAEGALSQAVWENTQNITGTLTDSEATMTRAVQIMQNRNETVTRFEDGETIAVTVPQTSRLPAMTASQNVDALQSFDQVIPGAYNENEGVALAPDEFSDVNKDRVLQVRDKDGSYAPLAIEPDVPFVIEMTDENMAMVRSGFLTVVERNPQAGEAGQITVVAPPVPERGAAPHQFGHGLSGVYQNGNWRIRHRTTADATKVFDALGATIARSEAHARREGVEVKALLDNEVKLGTVSAKAADNADTSIGATAAIIQAQFESKRDGLLWDTVESPFVGQTARTIQEHTSMNRLPANRQQGTPSPQATRVETKEPKVVFKFGDKGKKRPTPKKTTVPIKDRVVGYGFNLDRHNAKDIMLAAGIEDFNKIVRSERALTPAEMVELQKASIHDTLVSLRKRIGAENMASMNTQKISALTGLIETGSFGSKGRSDVLNTAMVKALTSRNYQLVADLVSGQMMRVDSGKVFDMTNSDLRTAAMNFGGKPLPGLADEIIKRKLDGTWNRKDDGTARRMIQLESMTTVEAVKRVILAFGQQRSIMPGTSGFETGAPIF